MTKMATQAQVRLINSLSTEMYGDWGKLNKVLGVARSARMERAIDRMDASLVIDAMIEAKREGVEVDWDAIRDEVEVVS